MAWIPKNTYILAGLILITGFFLHTIGILLPIERGVVIALRPLGTLLVEARRNLLDSRRFQDRGELRKENEKLLMERNELLVENANLKSRIEQSQLLREEILFLQEIGFRSEFAKIIGKDPYSTSQLFLLNKGRRHRIEVGQPVIVSKGIVVGKIVKVEEEISFFLSLSDSESSFSAIVQNPSSSPGLVIGKHGLALEMQEIPQGEAVEKNQMVLTSGLEERIPRGLIVGKITNVQKKTEELFQSATIDPLVPLDRLSLVAVIILR